MVRAACWLKPLSIRAVFYAVHEKTHFSHTFWQKYLQMFSKICNFAPKLYFAIDNFPQLRFQA